MPQKQPLFRNIASGKRKQIAYGLMMHRHWQAWVWRLRHIETNSERICRGRNILWNHKFMHLQKHIPSYPSFGRNIQPIHLGQGWAIASHQMRKKHEIIRWGQNFPPGDDL